MTTFSHYDAQLTGRNALRRKVANNTYAERRGDDRIAIRLHNTDVVTFDRDGTITLNSGGWRTATTKERMNEFTPLSIHQDKGVWYVTHGRHYTWNDDGSHVLHEGTTVIFADGMTWHDERGFEGDLKPSAAEMQRRGNEKVKKDIRTFVNGITPERIVEAWENPGGDCLICRFDMDSCLGSHVEEGYFHATLAYRAVKERGYRHPDVIMGMIYHEAKRGHVDRLLTDTLAKFLRKHLLQGVATR